MSTGADRARRSAAVEAEARRIVPGVVEGTAVERVVLYGSVARGEAGRWSDCDLAFVGPEHACGEAKWRLPRTIAGLEPHVLVMSGANGFGEVRTFGGVGREVAERGRTLWEDGWTDDGWWERVSRPGGGERMAVEGVARRHGDVLWMVRVAVEAVSGWMAEREEEDVRLALRASFEAGRLALKRACIWRGRWYGGVEALGSGETRRSAADGPAVLADGAEAWEGVEALARRCGEADEADAKATHSASGAVGDADSAGERALDRTAAVLAHGHAETARLVAAPGLDGIEDGIARTYALLEAEAAKLAGCGGALGEAARRWRDRPLVGMATDAV